MSLDHEEPVEEPQNNDKPSEEAMAAARRLFDRYSNKPEDDLGADRIGPHGVFELLADLRLEPTDRKVLVLAWLLNAKVQCEFGVDEWIAGLSELGVRTIDELRSALESRERDLENDRSKFKELYRFAYTYGKLEFHRTMECETAINYWQILFKNRYTLLNVWAAFLREHEIRAITKDVWYLVFEFFETVDANLSNYDEDGAWPVLLVNFVDHVKRGIVGSA